MTHDSPAGDTVTVVIPTFNRSGFLGEMVAALRSQTNDRFSVVFVDDGSTDDTLAVLEGAFGGDERFSVLHTANRGPSSARNAGCLTATSTWVAFTDDDCVPQPSWLRGLVEEAHRTGATVVQGKTLTDPSVDLRDQPWFVRGRDVTGWNGIFQTCNLMVRTADLQAVGGFDERFPPHGFGEDRDLGARLISAGATTAFAAAAELHHRVMPMRYWEFLKRRYRWSHIVQVVSLNPVVRTTLRDQGDYLFRVRYVSHFLHLAFWAGLLVSSWAIATGRWWVVPVGIAGYMVDRLRRTRREGRSGLVRLARAPLELVGLAVESAGFVIQSVRYRTLLL